MFGKQDTKKEPQAGVGGADRNIIGSGTTITGTIETVGSIRVDGILKGDLISKGKLAMGPDSRIEGNVTVQNAEIEGKVTGILTVSEIVMLKSTAVVLGEIYYGKMVMQSGAEFNGKAEMIGQNSMSGKAGGNHVSQKTKQPV